MAKRIQRKAPPATRSDDPTRPAGGGGRGARRGGRVKGQLVTDFTVQLATLSEAGIPVVKALTILSGQARSGAFKDVLEELTEDVSGGAPLSEAMAKHRRCFDELFTSMVRAGEAGGILDRILQRIATYREKAAELRGKVFNAMIYPMILIVIATVLVSGVMVFVIPKFQEIFDSFNIELPQVTRVLLAISDAALNYWYLVFGVPVLLVLLHSLFMGRSDGYRYRMHALWLKLPVAGDLSRQVLTASFSRNFGTLVQAGVPHLDALGIVRDATANSVMARSVEDVRRTVREGEGIARPMGETGLFDDIVINMVDVGEETGELDGMLLKVADSYERTVDRRVDALFRLLEPVIMILMAVVVGFIVVALFMPLLEIMSGIQ